MRILLHENWQRLCLASLTTCTLSAGGGAGGVGGGCGQAGCPYSAAGAKSGPNDSQISSIHPPSQWVSAGRFTQTYSTRVLVLPENVLYPHSWK